MIEFDTTTEPSGLVVYDSIEQRRLRLETDSLVSPAEASTASFCFPVDTRCSIEVTELVFDRPHAVTLHDGDGVTEASFDVGETGTLDDRVQYVGISGPIKLYCRIEVPGEVEIGLTSTRIRFDRTSTIELGARSLHDRPVGTITTPADVDSMTTAISATTSALKTTSPERTWPTLRGHPPLLELGDRLEIPDPIERARPDTEVTLTIPPNYAALFSATPLAFFLGADLRSGSDPALSTDRFERSLPAGDGFEDEMVRLLKRFFFLDCLVRTEGVFQYDLYERDALESKLPFDLVATYDAPLPRRLERYLEVPDERIAEFVPRWPLTAHVPATPDSVELVPFVVNELGVIREARATTIDVDASAVSGAAESDPQAVRSASASRAPGSVPEPLELVRPDVTDESVEHAWFGDAVPYGASKATVEAYRNQLDRETRKASIDILLVCNDARMLEEHDLLDDIYGHRDQIPFDVDSEFGIDADRLATLLADGRYDFFHYIGHATEDGLQCSDGELDVRDLESVDVGVFFLNACRSYRQGVALTRRGAYGGVSTYTDVENERAVRAGTTLARLLNRGFPLRGALEIARQNGSLTDEYLIVGDGSTDVAQSNGGSPALIELTRRGDAFDVVVQSYSTKEFKLGSATASNLSGIRDRHLSPSSTPVFRVDRSTFHEYATWAEPTVVVDGELYWNDGMRSFLDD